MFKSTFAIVASVLMISCANAQDISLPAPSLTSEMTLADALNLRHSSREFADTEISDQVLSQLLWAACGINRPESKKITAPSAINAQDIVVYVVRKDGAYRYEPQENILVNVCGKDLRKAVAGRQEAVANAPICLVLVSDHKKFGDHKNGAERMGCIDSGYVSENIALMCTALGLNTVPRMSMDAETLRKELKLDADADLLLNHPVGYAPK
ncbi:MAG: SagB/ThcOx family dehydrogenase [Prevotella sp.]